MTPTIYTDPYTGYEILVLEKDGRLFGAAYDPRRTGMPTPWHQDCHHCQYGRQNEFGIHIKRNIQLLCTSRSRGLIPNLGVKITEYTIPSNIHVHTLRHWTIDNRQFAHILDDQKEVLRASRAPLEKMQFEGDKEEFRSTTVHRCLQFIFSGRPASRAELEASTKPLAEAQRTPTIHRGRRNVCDTIVWAKVLG